MTTPEFEIRPTILVGDSADISYQRTLTVLRNESVNPIVTLEFYASRDGILCGMREVRSLLGKVLPETGSEVWALDEGDPLKAKETVLRISAPYSSVGMYQTAICGILAPSSAWATAARECVDAAAGKAVVSYAARHVHPNVAANIDYAAVVGGCVSCSTVLGARLAGITPTGNMPHTLPLILGDSVKAIQAFDRHIPLEVPRVALVDTFKDEVEESLNVARALRERLRGVRLDTARERGGVTPDLVKEVRASLDLAGFRHVEIIVSGGFSPERIRSILDSGAAIDGFAVGSYIASARPNDFTADIREIDGKPVAKRGRTPGLTASPRLDRVM